MVDLWNVLGRIMILALVIYRILSLKLLPQAMMVRAVKLKLLGMYGRLVPISTPCVTKIRS